VDLLHLDRFGSDIEGKPRRGEGESVLGRRRSERGGFGFRFRRRRLLEFGFFVAGGSCEGFKFLEREGEGFEQDCE